MNEILFLIFLIFLTNFFLKKKNILLNNTGQIHQSYNQKYQVPLSGGLVILIYIYYNFEIFNLPLIFYLTIFFILGLFADLNLFKSPTLRFITQILLLIFFLIHLKVQIYDIRINWINDLLQYQYFNIFFVLLCFLVLINGTNFIDGNNGISIGYYLIIFFLIFKLINYEIIVYDVNFFGSFLFVLTILLIFNLFNKLYIGDSGAYLLSVFSGYILIDIINQNQNLSPYFIVNIFWYPAFEILFSLIRKIKYKYSPLKPDTKHLHQLLFFYYSKKIRLSKSVLNSFTGLSVNIFNGLILYFASMNLNNTKIQLAFVLLSLTIYIVVYFILSKFKNNQ
tara:strand:- start:681 stop:1691 length:1011 start_codon:yes stop_codon:yes gene_type:complete